MNTTKLLSIIALLSCATQTYSMQKNPEKIPTIEVESLQEIDASIKKMVATCKRSPEGVEKCMTNWSEQMENYQIRKCTDLCAGRPHDEKFSYKNEDDRKGQAEDMRATAHSYSLRGGPGSSVDKCVNQSLALFSRRLQCLGSKKHSEIKKSQAESSRLERRIQVLMIPIALKDIAARLGRFFSGD